MKSERIYAAIGAVDDELLLRCENPRKKGISMAIKIGSLAACLCLIIWGATVLFQQSASFDSGRPVLEWSQQFTAADYFKYNSNADIGMSSSGSIADSAIPYAETRSFSDERNQLEMNGVIPLMPEYPMFDCAVNYNNDGSIYSVVFSWHQRGNFYSDLRITAGYQEVERITDCIFIELDDKGNIIEPAVTVTIREGVQIVAEGNESRAKTITFQNESGWYQIEGSWNDSYEPMVALLDWIWTHPIDFNRFPIEAGDHFTTIRREEMPEAFAGYIPDFSSFGYIEETNYLVLKNGSPYAYEGHFIGNVSEELVKARAYYDVADWTIIHWCIQTAPEYYNLEQSIGELGELTQQMVVNQFDELPRNQSRVSFTWDGLLIIIYSNTVQDLWSVLETLQQP